MRSTEGEVGRPRRYALCGLSARGVSGYALPLLGLGLHGERADEGLAASAELVAVVDPDATRVDEFNAWLTRVGSSLAGLPRFDSIAELIGTTHVDGVIIASPDHTHLPHAVAGLEHGVEVIIEKPMVITTKEAHELRSVEARTSGRVVVAHNYRYPPRHLQLKELLRAGTIGRPVQVLFEYHVDTSHGASYFVRWNREKRFSGGLTLHKSTHHVDLISWLLDDEPATVAAVGGRHFYGREGAQRPYGSDGRPVTGSALRDTDPYWQGMVRTGAVDHLDGRARRGVLGLPYEFQYPAGTEYSVYDDEIDSLDTISAIIGYRGGAGASYLINFSSPWEGYRLVVNGTQGQLETVSPHRSHGDIPLGEFIVHRPLFGEPVQIRVATGFGTHEGADPLMRRDLFCGPDRRSRDLNLQADSRQGALAVAVGEAMWQSAESGATQHITFN